MSSRGMRRKERRPHHRPTVALALGGGSSRGLAHILMLEALDELGVKPVAIAGTSIGAIMGSAYAAGLSAAEIRGHAERLLSSKATLVRRLAGALPAAATSLWSLRSPTIVDGVTLFEILMPEELRRDFSMLKIPFVAVATDFYAMEQVVLDHGPVIPAVAASCTLPMMMRPVTIAGRVLLDGGFVNPTPFDLVRDKADITVAVDVTGDTIPRPGVEGPTPTEAWIGATQITFHSITREKLKQAAPDILIRPEVGAFASMDYYRYKEIFAAAEPAKAELKQKLAERLELVAG